MASSEFKCSLLNACIDSDVEMIKHLVQQGADVNVRGSPLIQAVRSKSLACVQVLVEAGANVNFQIMNGDTALSLACKNGWTEFVEYLVNKGADVDALDCNNYSPLIRAVEANHRDCVQVLLEAGANINVVTSDGNAALLIAFKKKDLLTILSLLNYGADLKVCNNYFESPLYKLLRPEIYKGKLRETALSIVKLLIKRDFDVNKEDKDGLVPLHFAAKLMDEKMIAILLEAQANVNHIERKQLCTPFHYLLKYNDCCEKVARIARLFLKNGADLTASTKEGFTVLQFAVKNHHIKVIKIILAKMTGIDERVLESYRIRVRADHWSLLNELYVPNIYEFHVAIAFGFKEVVKSFIDKGIKSKMSLSKAIKACEYDITKLLLESGCQLDRFASGINHFPDLLASNRIMRVFRNSDMRLISLLWSLQDNKFFKKLLDRTLSFSKRKRIIHLLILCYAIDKHLGNRAAGLISIKNKINSSMELKHVLRECNKKLKELKTVKVGESMSQLDILSKKFDVLVRYLENKNNLTACTSLCISIERKFAIEREDYQLFLRIPTSTERESAIESHEYLLLERIDLAIEKRKLLDDAKDYLNEVFKPSLERTEFQSLPNEIMWNIMGYLNIRELRMITKGMRN